VASAGAFHRRIRSVHHPRTLTKVGNCQPRQRVSAFSEQGKALDDPELFATYTVLVGADRDVIARHVAGLVAQIGRIIADGVAEGTFAATDVDEAARAVFDATVRFHDPMYAGQWADPATEVAFDRVVTLILKGLAKRAYPVAVVVRGYQ
jgi:hypothetical protein